MLCNKGQRPETMMAVDRIARGLLQGMQNQMDEELFHDVEVVAEEDTFQCHRFILSAASSFFKDRFNSNMQETNEGRVVLEDISADVFKLLLDFIYKGHSILNEENVYTVWYAANQLQIALLLRECEHFQRAHLNKQNCIQVFIHAKALRSTTLISLSWETILDNFKDLIYNEDMLHLDPEDMIHLVGHDKLQTTSEDNVIQAIQRWVRAGLRKENRENHLANLMRETRSCLVSGSCLQELLELDEILTNAEALREVQDALKYLMRPDRRHDFCPKNAIYRNNSKEQNCVMTVLTDPISERIACRDFNGKWFTLYDVFYGSPKSYNLISYGQTVFIIEPQIGKVSKYDFATSKEISAHTVLAMPNRPTAYAAHKEFIYSIEAQGSTSAIERVSVDKAEKQGEKNVTWKSVGKLSIPVSNVMVTTFGEHLVVFGQDKANEDKTVIQGFNTQRLDSFSFADYMPGSVVNMVSFKTREHTFVLQQDGSLWRLTSCEKLELEIVFEANLWDRDLNITLHGATVCKGELIVMGKIKDKDQCMEWKPTNSTYFQKISIINRSGCGLINTVVPKKIVTNPDEYQE